ncbi:MAG: hypothetical protein ACT443_15390 [Gemmatimonadota bacterium]
MPKPTHSREAYKGALQFEHVALRILNGITATHPQQADELAEYTNQMLRCVRRSNHCVGTKKGQQESIQAAVWMVELLIVLNDLRDTDAERALITAAIEILERVEEALRAEGSLPPVRE